jgi:hypothetical protein
MVQLLCHTTKHEKLSKIENYTFEWLNLHNIPIE